MAFTINYEGDDTDALNGFLAKIAHRSMSSDPWVVSIIERDDLSTERNYAVVGWQPARTIRESAALVVRPWADGEPDEPRPEDRPREIPTDQIAEITIH